MVQERNSKVFSEGKVFSVDSSEKVILRLPRKLQVPHATYTLPRKTVNKHSDSGLQTERWRHGGVRSEGIQTLGAQGTVVPWRTLPALKKLKHL